MSLNRGGQVRCPTRWWADIEVLERNESRPVFERIDVWREVSIDRYR